MATFLNICLVFGLFISVAVSIPTEKDHFHGKPQHKDPYEVVEKLKCYACTSYVPYCKSRVNDTHGSIPHVGCKSRCFLREGREKDLPLYRGCADDFQSVPDLNINYNGCRKQLWNGVERVWCFCDTDMCNGESMKSLERLSGGRKYTGDAYSEDSYAGDSYTDYNPPNDHIARDVDATDTEVEEVTFSPYPDTTLGHSSTSTHMYEQHPHRSKPKHKTYKDEYAGSHYEPSHNDHKAYNDNYDPNQQANYEQKQSYEQELKASYNQQHTTPVYRNAHPDSYTAQYNYESEWKPQQQQQQHEQPQQQQYAREYVGPNPEVHTDIGVDRPYFPSEDKKIYTDVDDVNQYGEVVPREDIRSPKRTYQQSPVTPPQVPPQAPQAPPQAPLNSYEKNSYYPYDGPCSQPKDTGPCYGYIRQWHYSPHDGTCKEFIFGGCQGNDNRFDSELACRKRCNAAPPTKSSCEDNAYCSDLDESVFTKRCPTKHHVAIECCQSCQKVFNKKAPSHDQGEYSMKYFERKSSSMVETPQDGQKITESYRMYKEKQHTKPENKEYKYEDFESNRPEKREVIREEEVVPVTPIPDKVICSHTGFIPNPEDCSTFLACIMDSNLGKPIMHRMRCPDGLYWDNSMRICVTTSSTCTQKIVREVVPVETVDLDTYEPVQDDHYQNDPYENIQGHSYQDTYSH